MKTSNLRTKKKVTTEVNNVEAQEEILEFLKQDAEAKYEAQKAIEQLLSDKAGAAK